MKLRLIGKRRAEQDGSVTMIALLTVAVIGVSLASYLKLTANQNVAITRAQYWNLEIPIAEAGIEEALTHLYFNGPTNLVSNGWVLGAQGYEKRRYLDTNSHYWVRISVAANPIVVSSGYVRQPLSTTFLSPRTVQVNTWRDGKFAKGMVAKGSIDLNGNNVRSDSFDSIDPLYSTGGVYDPAKFKDNGDIGSNSGIVGIINSGNADIYGHVSTGPGGAVTLGAEGAAGSTAWIAAGNEGIQPGWFTDDMNVSFPDVAAPFSGGAFAPMGGNLLGTNYTYLVTGGNYQMSSLTLSSQQKMLVTGNAVLYVTADVAMSGQSQIILGPGASLQMYVAGANATLAGNGIANGSGNALNFGYWGLPSNTSLTMGGNAAFTGMIYAPQAAFNLSGSGATPQDFSGSSVTGSVVMNGSFNFHYDENLGRNGPRRSYIVTNWVEL